MAKYFKWLVPVTVAGILLTVWGGLGAAQPGGARGHSLQGASPLSGKVAPQAPLPVSGSKTLLRSHISQDSSLVAVGAGFVPIDAATSIGCFLATTCTFTAEQNVQVSNSVAGNRWAICTALDGAFMTEPLCPFLGILPADSSFVGGSFVQTKSGVGPGSHTVQTFIYTDAGADRSIYTIIYRVYKP
jgi:hypothetical protein